MFKVIGALARMDCKVVQKDLDYNPDEVIESNVHCSLERGTSIDETKRHAMISIGTPSHRECGFVTVSGINENLIISRETM